MTQAPKPLTATSPTATPADTATSARPNPGYQTKQESIAISGVDDLIIRSLLDREQFSDPHGDAARIGISSAAWPLFGLPWPSGAQLAARLALRPVDLAENILEVGCGLALPSLVGHRRGANMTASDCHPLTERFLIENLRLNSLGPLKYRHGDWAASQTLQPKASSAVFRQRTVYGRYNLIIGSDLLYERDDNGGLADFVGQHARPICEVWIVDPDRSNRSAFTRRMAVLGFMLREERLDHPLAGGVAAYKGRLLVYTRVD